MELVVGASAGMMKSVMGKLSSLLAAEYTLIRGVNGDLQYINDELATMQSFLRAVTARHGQDDLMEDWMKQIRDVTYDIEDCIDDSGGRLHGLRADICCYSLVNGVYELFTWWPRHDVAARISVLKMRAQQIGERRNRYGVNNPETGGGSATSRKAARFDPAGNQESSHQLVTMKVPVGVDEHMEKPEKFVTLFVGFGGVGKTAIATALYKEIGEQFGHRAMVTVSQSSDREAILKSIESQFKPQSKKFKPVSTSNNEQQGGSAESCMAALGGAWGRVSRVTSAVTAKWCSTGTADEMGDKKLDEIRKGLEKHLEEDSYLVLIDDVWSASMLEKIIHALPRNNGDNRIIVTTRFHAVATTQREVEVRTVKGLPDKESKELFVQAFLESNGSKHAIALLQAPATISMREQEPYAHSKQVPGEVWKMCGGLPLALVTIAGHVACSPNKLKSEWHELCNFLFPEAGKNHWEAGSKSITQEELGRIISHCFDDMPAEIKTCSLYLSIFPKGYRISRKRLTRRWIAEGFVRENQGLSVEDVAETYFNHLIRRKIIRPVEHNSNGKVKKCIVHDMVLEHIVAKASEENFITVVGGNWFMQPPSSKVRRLSLQVSDSKRTKDTEKMNLTHVRSLTMFGSLNNQLPHHSFKFGIVQVLDLEGCMDFKQHHAKEICKMLLLKYLSLRGTDTKWLPGSIRKLKNLETMDVRETNIVELPSTICQLERLVNILGGDKTKQRSLKIPEELEKKKKMKGLRILSGIEIVEGAADFHHLTELRKLAIYKLKTMKGDASFTDLSSSIEYLGGYSLRTLIIDDESSEFIKSLDGMSSPPKFLTSLELYGKMVKLPGWIKELGALNNLTISLTALRADNLIDLSNLDTLFSLTFSLRVERQDPQTLSILAENKMYSNGEVILPGGGFKSLKLLRFIAPLLPSLSFSEEAMPQLERLELQYTMLEGLFGVEKLASLREVHLTSGKAPGDMTEEIVREMKSADKRINAKELKIIQKQCL